MQFVAHEEGLRVVEVPITVRYEGPTRHSVWQQGMVVLNGVLRLTGQYRPLLSFGVPGLVILAGGGLMGVLVVDLYSRFGQLAVGYALISVLLSVIGMTLLSTAVILHSVRALMLELFRSKGR
jgi:hypothetical protein